MWILRILGGGLDWIRKVQQLCMQQYLLGRLGEAGQKTTIGEGVHLHGAQHIRVGNHVSIAHHVTLRALTVYPWSEPPQTFSPEIILKDRCFINSFSQISCARRVVIGENVMIAEHCLIADHNHGYAHPDLPIRAQPLEVEGEVHIGADSWIGANCSIVGNVRIGRHCVVGAHSVVTADIPDYSVAVGAPARIVKRYDRDRGLWVSVPRP
jgi:acetyltransferase-like isoleucine patch superfamily enzyme